MSLEGTAAEAGEVPHSSSPHRRQQARRLSSGGGSSPGADVRSPSFPPFPPAVQALKAEGAILALFSQDPDLLCEVLYAKDQALAGLRVDDDVLALWRGTAVPEEEEELAAELAKAGVRGRRGWAGGWGGVGLGRGAELVGGHQCCRGGGGHQGAGLSWRESVGGAGRQAAVIKYSATSGLSNTPPCCPPSFPPPPGLKPTPRKAPRKREAAKRKKARKQARLRAVTNVHLMHLLEGDAPAQIE